MNTASAGVASRYAAQASQVRGMSDARCRSEMKSIRDHSGGAANSRTRGQRGNRRRGHARYTSAAETISTSSSGTSPWPPRLPVATPSIASTTSVPATTLPNTA